MSLSPRVPWALGKLWLLWAVKYLGQIAHAHDKWNVYVIQCLFLPQDEWSLSCRPGETTNRHISQLVQWTVGIFEIQGNRKELTTTGEEKDRHWGH